MALSFFPSTKVDTDSASINHVTFRRLLHICVNVIIYKLKKKVADISFGPL